MPRIEELDSVLEPFKSSAFKDKVAVYQGYRNHCQRVANAALINLDVMGTVTPKTKKLVAVAAAFHDIGIWTHHTWDYLTPSWKDAKEYMTEKGLAEFSEEDQTAVVEMIEEHHKIFPIKWEGNPNSERLKLVEAFRRGDWMDVTSGFLRGDVSRPQLKELYLEFPVSGFFGVLLSIAFSNWLHHPFSNPMPMMRW